MDPAIPHRRADGHRDSNCDGNYIAQECPFFEQTKQSRVVGEAQRMGLVRNEGGNRLTIDRRKLPEGPRPIHVDRRKLPENKRKREHEEYVKGGRGAGSQLRVGRKAGNPQVKLNDVLKGVL